MRNKILKIILVIAVIIVVIYAIKVLKSTNQGTPNQSERGSPIGMNVKQMPPFTTALEAQL
ncbi:MAG: hypothetical protein WKF66_04050 [Pedobacter sp.]